MQGLLEPDSVAVVGASAKPGSVAGTILKNLQDCGYRGTLHPVHPVYEEVFGLPCVRSVDELPPGIDLVVVAIHRDRVLKVVEACGRRGIVNLVIITAGFKESGERGAALEDELRRRIDRYRLNVVGPNCMGIINSSERMRLNASFSRWFPPGGEIAFVSQSGSLGETLLECFEDAGLGVSRFINLGNRAGLTENDFLEHLRDDDGCGAIFLYLESFADPRRFRELVSDIVVRKPVIVLKAGRTEAGAAAVASHTGSLASSDAVVEAFLDQCGALRVTTIEETLTGLQALERGVLPRGGRVGILTNAGGAGILTADACVRAGLDVPPLSADARGKLAAFLPPEAGLGNPVDMIATATAMQLERGLDLVLEETDAAIVIFRPPLVFREPLASVASGLVRAAEQHPDRPVLVCTLSHSPTVQPLVVPLREAGIPAYAMPETAVAALSVLYRARRPRRRNGGAMASPTVDQGTARAVLGRALEEGRRGLFFDEGARLLAAYGIAVCPHAYADSDEGARQFLAEIGPPLVAKVDAPELAHRFEQGAVITGIETEGELDEAIGRLRGVIDRLGLGDGRLLLQKMLVGRELIFGVERDPVFGPAVMFGIGGTLVEALRDVAFGVAPISTSEAKRMVRSIRAFPLLEAFRGQPAVALQPLVETIVALGRIGLELPELQEIDLNPVIAGPHGAAAVDLLIRIDPCPAEVRDTAG